MTRYRYGIACCVLIVLSAVCLASGNLQHLLNIQRRTAQLPDTKFSFNEYSEYSDTEDREKGSLPSRWNQATFQNYNGNMLQEATNANSQSEDVSELNIKFDSSWIAPVKSVQISAVSIDPNGNIAIFHRGSRIWGARTFDNENRFNPDHGPIRENTIVLVDKAARKLAAWGSNMFYLPHGLTVDSLGNYWITDVALHQVFKFNAKDVERHIEELKKQNYDRDIARNRLIKTVFPKIVLEPTLALGQPFEPGNDNKRFCKPTAVAVESNGDFFVSDGYCNSRIIKFNANGERILEWGRHWGLEANGYLHYPPPNAFFVPHALAIAPLRDRDSPSIIFVADRENGRVVSFFTNNGTFHKEYKHTMIQTKVYSIAYAQGKLYLVNGHDMPGENVHVTGFVLDVASGQLLSRFSPGHDMDRPHDIAVTETGSEIYVAELNQAVVYKFVQDVNSSAQTGDLQASVNQQREPAPLMENDETASSGGCLLTMRKRMQWETERRENFKLSSLLESKRGKGFKFLEKRPNPRDFSKLNTEPETSEDEHPANSLARVI